MSVFARLFQREGEENDESPVPGPSIQPAPSPAPSATPLPAAPSPGSPPPPLVPPPLPAPRAKPVSAPPAVPALQVAVPAHELVSSVDRAFDDLLAPPPAATAPARQAIAPGISTAADLAALHATYAELAVEYCAPVRNVMIEVRWGEPPVLWLEVVRSALVSLRAMAAQVDLPALAAALDRFNDAVKTAIASGEPVVGPQRREQLLEAYAQLPVCLPRAFDLEGERDRREPIILRSLLLLVPDLGPLTVERFFSAGLNRIETIAKASPEEVAAVTGIAVPLAAEILAQVRAERTLAAGDPAEELRRLGALAAQLAEEHLAQARAAAGWSAESRTEKRRWRGQRERTLLRIKISLARLGEVERIERLDCLPFARKIEDLESLLRAAPPNTGARG